MAENETNYLGPITNITDNGKKYYISLENISAIQDKIGEILNSLAAKEAEDTTKSDAEKHAVYTVEAKKHLETLYNSLIGSSEAADSEVIDTLKEVLDLLRNFPESQDLKELLDEINNTINSLDLSQVGTNGKYIKFVSQENGQLAATAESFNTSVTNASTDNNAPTSKAVYTAINTAINDLDITDITNTAGKTISKITEADGKVGAEFQDIQITKAQAGLDQVDNTSDANKPVSSATQTALDTKLNKLITTGTYVYTHNGNTQGEVVYTSAPDIANSIVQRGNDKQINVPQTPTENYHAASKKYIDDELATKQNSLEAQTAYSAKGSSYKVPQITTNTLGQVTLIEEKDISTAAITDTAGSESISVNTSADNSKTLNIVTRDTDQTISGNKTFSNISFSDTIGSNTYNSWISEGLGSLYIRTRKGDSDLTQGNIVITIPTLENPTATNIAINFPAKNGTVAIDEDIVHKTSDETISGTKYFVFEPSGSPAYTRKISLQPYESGGSNKIVHTIDNGTTNYKLALPSKDGTLAIDEDVIHKTGTESIDGQKTFTDLRVLSGDSAPLIISDTKISRGYGIASFDLQLGDGGKIYSSGSTYGLSLPSSMSQWTANRTIATTADLPAKKYLHHLTVKDPSSNNLVIKNICITSSSAIDLVSGNIWRGASGIYSNNNTVGYIYNAISTTTGQLTIYYSPILNTVDTTTTITNQLTDNNITVAISSLSVVYHTYEEC